MKVLVTGGAGFIGTSVIGYFLGQGASVVNLDKFTYAASRSATVGAAAEDERYVLEVADTANRAEVDRIFAQHRPEALLHLAGDSHVDRSIDHPDEFVRANLTGTLTLLEAARHYWQRLSAGEQARFRFHHVSTAEVFGSLGADERAREEAPYRPSSPYAASKAGADLLLHAWFKTYGLPVLVTHSSNNYGPRQFPEKLVPLMILNAIEGRPLPVYGTGSNLHDWVYVGDHARALWQVLKHGRPDESYNIGGDAVCSNLELVHTLCSILDEILPRSPNRPHARLITLVADRPGHDRRYAVNDAKIRTELGWCPQESLVTGLRKTVEWYLNNRAWWEPIRSRVYRGERLGQIPSHPDDAAVRGA